MKLINTSSFLLKKTSKFSGNATTLLSRTEFFGKYFMNLVKNRYFCSFIWKYRESVKFNALLPSLLLILSTSLLLLLLLVFVVYFSTICFKFNTLTRFSTIFNLFSRERNLVSRFERLLLTENICRKLFSFETVVCCQKIALNLLKQIWIIA